MPNSDTEDGSDSEDEARDHTESIHDRNVEQDDYQAINDGSMESKDVNAISVIKNMQLLTATSQQQTTGYFTNAHRERAQVVWPIWG